MSFSYAELSQTLKNTIPVTVHTLEKTWKQALLKLLQITAVHSSTPQDSKLSKPMEFLYN